MKTMPTILILEDEALIALDVENTLLDAGAGETILVTSRNAALLWLSENTPDVAVIEISLRDGECVEIARALTERRVPFIVHSTRRDIADSNHAFWGGRWICKPSEPSDLIDAVKECLQREPASTVPHSAHREAAHAAWFSILRRLYQSGRYSHR